MFQRHPSSSLNELYSIKNYQGQNPKVADILFVGKDPNWCIDIESSNIFHLVTEYLNDGVNFWYKYNIHHPFLNKDYAGDGKKYHQAVARINIPSHYSNKISFIELIGFSTTGMSSVNYKQFNEYLLSNENKSHLEELDYLLNDSNKTAFLYWGMIEQLKFINKHTGLFKKLSKIDKTNMIRTDLNKFENLYFHKHFSMGISRETLYKISVVINDKLK